MRTGAEIGAAQQDLPRLVIQRETAQLAVFLLMRLEKIHQPLPQIDPRPFQTRQLAFAHSCHERQFNRVH